jgi:purine-binding chemotaxis protein CheW
LQDTGIKTHGGIVTSNRNTSGKSCARIKEKIPMSKQPINDTARYLSFRLEDEIFALNVIQVTEILDMCPITKVPRTPEFMRGIINVRGSVIPVLDFRKKFGLEKSEETIDTRIIVMQIDLNGDAIVMGAIADSVHEVMEIEPEQIEPPPKIGTRWQTEFIRGIGKREDEFVIILDIDRLFSTDELVRVQTPDGLQEESEAVEAAA